jgi:hypothetical protein
MAGNLDAFHEAQTRLEEAEERASALVEEVKRLLAPLFDRWQSCYPLTSPTDIIPPLLMRADQGGPVHPINVATLAPVWAQIQTAMAQYAEAKQQAAAASERLSPEENRRLRSAGTLTDVPPGGGRVTLDPSRFRIRR